jgi:hypothetical protein
MIDSEPLQRVEVVEARADHLPTIAANIHISDLWRFLDRFFSEKGFELSLAPSEKAYSATIEGRVVCMFGVAPDADAPNLGRFWLYSLDFTDHPAKELSLVRRIPQKCHFLLLQCCRGKVQEMLYNYNKLRSDVGSGNTVAIRWLKRFGFSVTGTGPIFRFSIERRENNASRTIQRISS